MASFITFSFTNNLSKDGYFSFPGPYLGSLHYCLCLEEQTICLFSFLSASSNVFNALYILKSIHSRKGGRCHAGDSTDEETSVSSLSKLRVWCCNHVPYTGSPNKSHSPWPAISPAWNRGTGSHYSFWEMPRASIRE